MIGADINALLDNFHGALVALVPYFEAAEVTWNDGEAYDEFDRVAEVLYESLVASAIRGESEPVSAVPRYGFEPEADARKVVWVESNGTLLSVASAGFIVRQVG
jgi:hypothetical protein